MGQRMGQALTHTLTHTPIAHNGDGGILCVRRLQRRDFVKYSKDPSEKLIRDLWSLRLMFTPSPNAHRLRRGVSCLIHFVSCCPLMKRPIILL